MPDKEQTPPSDPAFSRQVLEMLTVANEFCLFLEKADEYSKEFILSYLQKVCPLIYIKASLMPEVIVEEDDAAEDDHDRNDRNDPERCRCGNGLVLRVTVIQRHYGSELPERETAAAPRCGE